MGQDFRDEQVAKRWDERGSNHNPLRQEQLEILVHLIRQSYRDKHRILDLGYGTGQVDKLIFDSVPKAQIVGVDWSQAMMEIAKRRLEQHKDQFESIKWDLSQLSSLALPPGQYQIAIAVQSLHHLTPEAMKEGYRWIFENLEPGGAFFLQDRVRVENEHVFPLFVSLWQRVDHMTGSELTSHEGESYERHVDTTQARGDYPVLLEEHLAWLKDVGFEAACLQAYGHRALIGAVKPVN